jgi:hypothetical protein
MAKLGNYSNAVEPEYGGVHIASRLFDMKETLLWKLDREGKIQTVLIRTQGSKRGKRLFKLDSIRAFLRSLEKTHEKSERPWVKA